MTEPFCEFCTGHHDPRIDCERRVFHDDEEPEPSSAPTEPDDEDWLKD